MATTRPSNQEIPGRVFFTDGNNELPKIIVKTAFSTAELYLHGAHVTHFQKNGEPPILWMSQLSKFEAGAPIRGGIPLVFPWFGPREGKPTHGFARLQEWELREICQSPDSAISLRLALPESPEAALLPKFAADILVTIGKTLALELTVANQSKSEKLTFESCFHTYFTVGDIHRATVTGLKGVDYIDRCDKSTRKTEQNEPIKIAQEVDRLYPGATAPAEIHDPALKRRIRINKTGSRSTVVWNPWIDKSQRMPDFGDEEYLQMLCVESGNVADDSVSLAPGQSASLRIEIDSLPLNS